eukprot:5440345-Pleurochrysis_carterae.AAC.3
MQHPRSTGHFGRCASRSVVGSPLAPARTADEAILQNAVLRTHHWRDRLQLAQGRVPDIVNDNSTA